MLGLLGLVVLSMICMYLLMDALDDVIAAISRWRRRR